MFNSKYQGSLFQSSLNRHSLLDSIKDSLSNYSAWGPEFAFYAGIAFLIGFLTKHFGKYVCAILFVAIATIFILQYTGIIVLSCSELAATLGIPDIASCTFLLTPLLLWSREHIAATTGIAVGFVLGWCIA